MRYIFLILLISTYLCAEQDDNLFIYTEIYGPQQSLLSPNVEITLKDYDLKDMGIASFRARGALRFMGISLFNFYPSYLLGLHIITGIEHKLDLGFNFIYQMFDEDFLFNSGLFYSVNLGYRHNINDFWFVGFSFNPTYSKENKPFYPTSLKFGFVVF